jgi:hypothetical protein
MSRARSRGKSEARNPKSETNPKHKEKCQKRDRRLEHFFFDFGFVSDFELRISCFELLLIHFFMHDWPGTRSCERKGL